MKTKETMALIELIEKGADSDVVREMLAFAGEKTRGQAEQRYKGL